MKIVNIWASLRENCNFVFKREKNSVNLMLICGFVLPNFNCQLKKVSKGQYKIETKQSSI
jgi:hypothetical protein